MGKKANLERLHTVIPSRVTASKGKNDRDGRQICGDWGHVSVGEVNGVGTTTKGEHKGYPMMVRYYM